jgi:hypothetical protein
MGGSSSVYNAVTGMRSGIQRNNSRRRGHTAARKTGVKTQIIKGRNGEKASQRRPFLFSHEDKKYILSYNDGTILLKRDLDGV